jgi:hypothetical protein
MFLPNFVTYGLEILHVAKYLQLERAKNTSDFLKNIKNVKQFLKYILFTARKSRSIFCTFYHKCFSELQIQIHMLYDMRD